MSSEEMWARGIFNGTIFFVEAGLLYIVWPQIMPIVFHLPELTYWQCVLLKCVVSFAQLYTAPYTGAKP